MGIVNRACKYLKGLTREDIVVLLIVVSPLVLTILIMLIGEADQRATQRRLENRPAITWREILTPEEREKLGLDQLEGTDQRTETNRKKAIPDHGKRRKGETAFEEDDFYDILDYNGGLDGEYSDIDYHDIEDYYSD